MPETSKTPHDHPVLRNLATVLAVIQAAAGAYVIFDGYVLDDWTLAGVGLVTATMAPGWYALARSRRPPVT